MKHKEEQITMNTIRLLLLGALIMLGAVAFGQDAIKLNGSPSYTTAIGLRAGGPGALTIKHFTGPSFALEGMIGVWNNGMRAKLLFEKHSNAFGVAGLNWYAGAGPQVSFYDERYWYNNGRERYYRYQNDEVGLGVSGIVGLEYKITPIPVAMSLDLNPSVEVVSDGDIWADLNPGVGIKFTF